MAAKLSEVEDMVLQLPSSVIGHLIGVAELELIARRNRGEIDVDKCDALLARIKHTAHENRDMAGDGV